MRKSPTLAAALALSAGGALAIGGTQTDKGRNVESMVALIQVGGPVNRHAAQDLRQRGKAAGRFETPFEKVGQAPTPDPA